MECDHDAWSGHDAWSVVAPAYEHRRRRSECNDCGGTSMCQHGRLRKQCKECGGTIASQYERLSVFLIVLLLLTTDGADAAGARLLCCWLLDIRSQGLRRLLRQISREINPKSTCTMRGHFVCILKATEDCTTGVLCAFHVHIHTPYILYITHCALCEHAGCWALQLHTQRLLCLV